MLDGLVGAECERIVGFMNILPFIPRLGNAFDGSVKIK
jgi:hypothetical protein